MSLDTHAGGEGGERRVGSGAGDSKGRQVSFQGSTVPLSLSLRWGPGLPGCFGVEGAEQHGEVRLRELRRPRRPTRGQEDAREVCCARLGVRFPQAMPTAPGPGVSAFHD